MGMQHRQRRHPRHVRGEAALVLEALAEAGMLQRPQHLRHQPAGEENTVPGARGQHQVAGDRAEHRAEHVDRAHAARVAVGGTRGDVLRLHRAGIHAGDLAERAVDVDQPGAADQAFVGHAPELRRQAFEDRDLFRRAGREADMAAFGFQRVVVAVAHHQRADAEAGAGPDHGIDAVARLVVRLPRPRRRAATTSAACSSRDRHRLRGEIIDQLQLLEAEHRRRCASAKSPRDGW